jgi:tetratricopeptide (TPR) repeat protein
MTNHKNTKLKEILSIPGNEAVYNALIKMMTEDKAIAFVGAGASAGMYPLWGEFIERLAGYALLTGKADKTDVDRWNADKTSTPQQRVNNIHHKLGDALYYSYIKSVFAPRKNPNGDRYTPIHSMLMRLPFRGYVTTNYDPALEFARSDIRTDSLTTGTPSWQDEDEVYRWFTGEAIASREDCPILWIHGYWQRPNSIVLNANEYAQTYRPGLYRRAFEGIWMQNHLVFIGFGFADPQFTFMVREMMRDIVGAHAIPRHIAILNLPLEKRQLPSLDAIREWRENLETDYHVRALFYPVDGSDHSALQVLLENLCSSCNCPLPTTVSASHVKDTAPVQLLTDAKDFPAKWVHQPTNDNKFTGRDDELSRLNRWVRDESVRAIGISAIGGTGKTALIGHWLKSNEIKYYRHFAGLFAWSFYQDRDSENFLYKFLLWANRQLGTTKPNKNANLIRPALDVLRTRSLIIVLDGLEILQEGPEDARYGAFLDGILREFLTSLCQENNSLAVLTSRFVFADLERYLGTGFQQLELSGLTSEQGAQLLIETGVGGDEEDRQQVSAGLEGHPLGLRIFAEALPDSDHDRPARFLDYAFRLDELQEGAPLSDKLHRLLIFYERKLPPIQIQLLKIVALFRKPVIDDTVLHLAHTLFAERTKESKPDDELLLSELKKLYVRGILSREPIEDGDGSTCHPILRDHFRSLMLEGGDDTARRAADLLGGKPSAIVPQSVKDIETVLLAIELLLDTGDFISANNLYEERLVNYRTKGSAFLHLPSLTEGLRSAMNFVKDETRRRQCEDKLSRIRMRFYLNEVGLYASHSGQYELALQYYSDRIKLVSQMKDAKSFMVGLLNKAELNVFLGRLVDAHRPANEVVERAREEHNSRAGCDGRACRAWITTLLGLCKPAAEDFAIANELHKKIDPDGDELYSTRGIHWAELLLRSGHPKRARHRTHANLRSCEPNQWNDDIARCHWMLACCALAGGRLDEADAELQQAEAVFHRGQMLFDLARLYLTSGQVALARKDFNSAIRYAADVINLAAPREMRLIYADALVLRGGAQLLKGTLNSASRAFDDAEYALRMARECSYAWAERDALLLQGKVSVALANIYKLSGEIAKSERFRNTANKLRVEADLLVRKLRLTESDFAVVENKTKAWRRK